MSGFTVGEKAVLVVGVQGTVDDCGDDTVTINGLTLPTRLNDDRGVRYLSVVWPDAGDGCDRDHCTPACDVTTGSGEEHLQDRLNVIEQLVRSNHDDHHDGIFRFCMNRVCREVAS